ncbi:MAG TPA: hypothetical protein VM198_14865 [Longimicrobiales bacterium]|nr:hypothetical protein [Longimicrobiales bacterium]
MIRATLLLGALLVNTPLQGRAQSNAELINQAVLPLPEALRDGARVIDYQARGQPTVLREGTNEMSCRLFSYLPLFVAQCHHRELTAMFDRYFELLGQGTSSDDAAGILDDEIEAGQLTVNNGGSEYLLTGANPESAELVVTVTIPGATGASTGLPTEESGDQPWLMWAGTQVAHIMIPQS